MKQSILSPLPLSIAIATIFAASSAQAVTVYETDDAYLNLTGEVAFEYVRDVSEDSEIESKTDNIDLEVKAGYYLENGVEVFGYYAFEFADAGWSEEQTDTDDDKTKDPLRDHYLGAKKGGFTLQYGDQDYAVDDYRIDHDLDVTTATEMVVNPDDSEHLGSQEVLLIKYKTDGFYVSSSYDFDIKSDDADRSETGYDIFAEYEVVDGLWLGAVYSYQDYFDDGDYVSYGAQVEYSGIKDLKLGASWTFGENYGQDELGDDVNNDATAVDFSAQYKITKSLKVSGGIGFTRVDDPDSINNSDEEDLTIYYVNANYNIRKNLDVYGEVYDEDQDKLGLLLGVSLDF